MRAPETKFNVLIGEGKTAFKDEQQTSGHIKPDQFPYI